MVEYELAESRNSPSTRRSFEVRTEAAQELQPAMCAKIEAKPQELEASQAELALSRNQIAAAQVRLPEQVSTISWGSAKLNTLRATIDLRVTIDQHAQSKH
jgi:hypothetical protein